VKLGFPLRVRKVLKPEKEIPWARKKSSMVAIVSS
jgi:hypothetical protein